MITSSNNDCLAFKTYVFCVSEIILNSDWLKHLDLMSEVFLHDDYVNVDVAIKGDNSLLHLTVIKALKVLHEQGFIPVLNYDLG